MSGCSAGGRARLHGSAIRLLWQHGKIDDHQRRATDEIVRVYERLTAAVACKVTRIGSEFRGGAAADWPDHLTEAYLQRYVPWREEVGLRPAGQGRSIASLVLDVVVEDAGPSSLKARYRVGYARVLVMLVEGLEVYVTLGGWRQQARGSVRAADFVGVPDAI